MKTIEEKAKAYNELLDKAKQIYNKENDVIIKRIIEGLFPELKDSEEERIRKSLSAYFAKFKPNDMWDADFSFGDIVAWLEKQSKASKVEESMREVEEKAKAFTGTHKGETSEEILAQMKGAQKPVDKVELKFFKIGDEIKTLNEESLTITKIDEKGYWSEDLFICGFDDAAKWELVKQKPADKAKPKFHEGDWVVPKQEWSEEDNIILSRIIADYERGMV